MTLNRIPLGIMGKKWKKRQGILENETPLENIQSEKTLWFWFLRLP
jgi:hypothetical protein